MTSSNPNVPVRAATPELEPEVKQGTIDRLLRRKPQTRRGPRDVTATLTVVPASAPVPTQGEIQARMRQQAQMIDQMLHDSDMQENWERIMNREGEFKHLDLRLDITLDHQEWQQEFARFKNLINTESIQNVLDRNFQPWQQHFLLPPLVNGEILKLQNENTKKYKEALKGSFSTAKDNIITKLTMVHFGLPVEPFTLNNILHADKDENDAEDAPEEPARVQRIMYAEAPLEFLDGYDQRGHGFAMIRRKTNMHLRGAGADKIDLQNADLGDSSDESETIHMRGGGAKQNAGPRNDEPELEKEWYLYGLTERLPMVKKQDSEAFRINASKLLGVPLPQDGTWEFVVDQYLRADKNQTTLPHLRSGISGGSFVVNNTNYHEVWNDFLRARVFQKYGDWVMVVNASRNGAPAPATFQLRIEEPAPPKMQTPKSPVLNQSRMQSFLNTTSKQPSNPSMPTSPEQTTSNPNEPLAPADKNAPKGPTRKAYYMLPNESPVEFEIENDYKDFKYKVRVGLGLVKKDHYHVVFYSKQLDQSDAQHRYLYSHWTVSGEGHYAQYVAPKLFGAQDEWIVVAVLNEADAPKNFWPLNTSAPAQPLKAATKPVGLVPTTVPIWHNGVERYEIKNSRFDFADVASRALKVDHEFEWKIYVDMYSLQMDQSTDVNSRHYDHTITVTGSFNQPSDEKFTNYIGSKLFDPAKNWGARIRLEDEPTLPELWYDTFERYTGVLYGYAGKLETSNNYEDFKNAALDLLALSDDDDWEFTVTIFPTASAPDFVSPTLQSQHNGVTKSTFRSFFDHTIQPTLDSAPWRIFVRKLGSAPPQVKEPHLGLLSVVRLNLAGRGTAYWKLPANMVPRYGVNQFQEDFFRANRVLFPARLPRPATDVKITHNGVGFNIGFGGMFLTKALLDALESFIHAVPRARSIELTVSLSPSQIARPLSLRQAGTEIRCRVFDLDPRAGGRNLGAFYDEILRASKTSIELSDENKLPAEFRLWRTAEDRESDGPSVLLSYNAANKPQAVAKFSNWLGDTSDLKTTCFWFRPEYTSYKIQDVDDPSKPATIWDATADQRKLAGFRAMLKNFLNDGDLASSYSFLVGDLQLVDSVQKQRFVISASDIEDSPWRRNLLDCLLRNISFVRKIANIDYAIDKTSPWGIPEVASTSQRTPTRRPITPPLTAPTTPIGNPGGRQAAASRFNQPRLLKAQAGTPIYSAYKPWIAEQNRQNDKKHRSWSEDISVIEPGQKPEVNIFGTHKELMESISSNFPIHFGQIVTSTDNMKLQEENRQLRMLVLDRMHKCYWCDTTFPLYETERITQHMAHHRAVMEEGGLFCPICGSEDWIQMNTAQRREHLIQDADAREGENIKAFWKDQRCLVCDIDLARVKPELVMRHFATHIPGVLKFCDRCGRDEETFMSEFEKMHHDRVCLQSDKAFADPRIFCNRCGAIQSGLSSKKKKKHDKVCSASNGGKHCHICSIDLSPWTTGEERQYHVNNCRPPAGPPRGFCTRCGKDLLNLSALETAAHEQECYMNEPVKRIEQRRVKDIDDKWNEMLHQRAKLRKERVQFQQMQDDALHNEVGPCPYDALHSFAGLSRQQILDHFRDLHPPQGDTTSGPRACPYQLADGRECLEPLSVPFDDANLIDFGDHVRLHHAITFTSPLHSPSVATQVFCPYPVGALKCNHAINLPLSEDEADTFIKHARERHTQGDGIVATPTSVPCPYRRPGDYFCDFRIGPPLNPNTLRTYIEHVKRDHEHDIYPPESSRQCPFDLAQRNEKCTYVIRYPLRSDNADQFYEHYKQRHMRPAETVQSAAGVSIACPYRGADGQTVQCSDGPFSLDNGAQDLVDHLHQDHFITGNTEVACPLDLLDGFVCNAQISLHNDAEDLFTHFRDVHPSVPIASSDPSAPGGSAGIGGPRRPCPDAFTCSLSYSSKEKGVCGIAISMPTTEAHKVAFNNHYQHAPGAGGPDSLAVLQVFNEFDRQLKDNLAHAQEERAAIIQEGLDPTQIEGEIDLIEAQIKNLAGLIDDIEHEEVKPGFPDATQPTLEAQTGFEPSPVEDTFSHRGTKRKATSDLPLLKRIPGESAQQYSNRLKRQRVGPNVVDYAGENEDESSRPRARAAPTAVTAPLREKESNAEEEKPGASKEKPGVKRRDNGGSKKKEVKSTPSKVIKNKKRTRSDEEQGSLATEPSTVIESRSPRATGTTPARAARTRTPARSALAAAMQAAESKRTRALSATPASSSGPSASATPAATPRRAGRPRKAAVEEGEETDPSSAKKPRGMGGRK